MVGAWAAVKYVNAFDKSIQPTSFRSFSVSGEGKVVSVPDIAQFSFGVVTEGNLDIAKLQTDNTSKVNKAIDFVKAQGVAKEDISTESYNLSPRYQYSTCTDNGVCPPAKIVGYTITQSVSVKIRDFAKISPILQGVVESGANSVGSLNFTTDDPSKVQDEARAKAIAQAKTKAESVAEAAGVGLGKLLSIVEGSNTPIPYYRDYAMESVKSMAGAPAPTIEPGSQDTTVTVTLTYEME